MPVYEVVSISLMHIALKDLPISGCRSERQSRKGGTFVAMKVII